MAGRLQIYADEVGKGIAAKRRKKHKEDEEKYSRKADFAPSPL
jgi:hypothetical protein